jgi:nitrate reductase NapE component
MTTPFVIVLQYFGADQPIFSFFERNPRNFGISFFVLALAFPLLTFAFNHTFDFIVSRFRPKKAHDTVALGGSYSNPMVSDYH